MPNFTRRKLIAGATAAASLAACTSTNPNPVIRAAALPAPQPLASQDPGGPIDPIYSEIYGEVKSEPYPVPAIKLAQINPASLRKNVDFAAREPPGTIVIDPANHFLYHVEEGGRATRYGVGVGREGFVWAGNATIKSK
ncbi:MAG: L,D-transpeptidase, partial [Beijerinckiaceae bacterium]|nr:L,D-transpeptidase [Beijerinckiaceae bacterium]